MAKSKGGGSANTGQGPFNNYQQYTPQYAGMPSYGNSSKGGGFGGGYGGGFGGGIPDFGGGNIGGGNYGGNFGGGGKRTGFKNQMVQPRMPSLEQQYASLNQGVQAFQPLGIRGYTPPPQFGFGGGFGGGYNGGFGGGYGGGFNPFAYNSFQGNPFLNTPTVPITQPPITTPSGPNYPGGSPYDFEPDFELGNFGYEDYDLDFEREYGLKDNEPLLSTPPPTYTTQVVEGGADIKVPTVPTPESVRPDFNADLNIPDFSNYVLPDTLTGVPPVTGTPPVADIDDMPITLGAGPANFYDPEYQAGFFPKGPSMTPPVAGTPPFETIEGDIKSSNIPLAEAIASFGPRNSEQTDDGTQLNNQPFGGLTIEEAVASSGRVPGQYTVDPKDDRSGFNPLVAGTPPIPPEMQDAFERDLSAALGKKMSQMPQAPRDPNFTPDPNMQSLTGASISTAPSLQSEMTELAELTKRAGGGSDIIAPRTLQPTPQKTSTVSSIMQFLGTDASEADSFDQATLLRYDYNKDGNIDLLDAQAALQSEEQSALKDKTFAEQNQPISTINPIEGSLQNNQTNEQQQAIMAQQMRNQQQALDNRILGPVRNSQSIIEYLGTDDGDSGVYDKTYDKNNDGVVDMLDAQTALQSEEANAIRPMPNPNVPAFTQVPIPQYNIGEVDPRRIGGIGGATGGLVKGYAVGGQIEGNESSDRLEEETIMALMGKHPNPKEVFTRYLEAYGEEGFMALVAEVEQMMASQGRMIEGQGDGTSDEIPAMIDGMQPAALSKDEYVIPADVVAHSGNGSSEAGGKKFDQLVSRVRKDKTGNTEQPEGIEFEQIRDEVIRQ